MKRSVSIFIILTVFTAFSFSLAFAEYRPSVSELVLMDKLLLDIGEIQGDKDHFPILTIRIGDPYKVGLVAYFFHSVEGGHAWILEEWEGLPDGKFRITYWRFFFYNESRVYTRVTTGQSIISGSTVRDIYYEVFVDIAGEDEPGKLASAKSEKVWQLLTGKKEEWQ